MSLFERIKNKRHNLTEQSDFTSKQRKDNINMLNKMFGSKERSKKTAGDVKKTVNISNKKETQRQKKIIKKNVEAGDKLLQDINKRKSADLTRADAINRAMGTSGSTEGAAGANTGTKTVNQADVSKKSKKFTDKINKQNKNLNPPKRTRGFENVTGEGDVKYPKTRKELTAKRNYYQIDKKGNIGKRGVEKYARNIKQSNLPLTKQDLSTAKQFAVGGKKIKDSTGKVVGTTTGKYGGRLARTRKPTKTIAQLKKEIELKDLNKAANYRAASTARSAELKDLTKKMGQKELAQRISQAAKLRTIRPQRQFYKGVMKPARSITKVLGAKQVAPAVKTGLKLATKAGPGGAIVAGTGIALLNPTIRAGAKKVAKAALGAAGIAAFAPKPKKMKIPKPTKISIGLSSGKSK